jgi:carotenoid cleavage dioxygenase-like enzyme
VVSARPGGGNDEGWLIVQCLDGSTERAFFALFDAARLDLGPIARHPPAASFTHQLPWLVESGLSERHDRKRGH